MQNTDFERETSDLFGHCLQAFHSFGSLNELAEDMRVLSLNAELAAGRAGERGASVRVLTQYTRELVYRLNSTEMRISDLKGQMYGHSVSAIRTLRQKSILERTSRSVQTVADGSETAASALVHVNNAHHLVFEETIVAVTEMVACVNNLSDAAEGVTNVGSQAASISTNIAIEAALSGEFEAEFSQVAHAMQGYVEQLRKMADVAGRTIQNAISLGSNLQQQATSNLGAK
ncbi:MAG: chemotaxis protein [Rhodospirillales bacterium]|nr:chemotaxis protein [Rhodospirillales bacterium]MBT4040100.1 chemotaxis protein [Rhodospirillales bacterium]MBT4627848.1 chemotaxis protein [Rhodospirillales bacterium]MBT5351388.1 chemotaxis protein [Rhodospirillales bacterium]MBT5522229.1 chemotaxis protein [Rhodospirillales bacterium]